MSGSHDPHQRPACDCPQPLQPGSETVLKPASPLGPLLKSWVNAALGLLYPEVCQICEAARATPAEGFVCAGCRGKARFIAPPFCERCGRPFEGAITTAFECDNCRELDLRFDRARSA